MQTKKAFSLLELIFVIAILGIVASVGSSIIANVYESYIMQRATHNASLKTELAINQLANRLLYRIDRSVIGRRINQIGNTPLDMVPLAEITPAQAGTHVILEWIGYDNDGFSTQGSNLLGTQPAWSGFTDLNPAADIFNTFSSTGSQLIQENIILDNLFPNRGNPALLFSGTHDYRRNAAGQVVPYTAFCMYTNINSCIFPVNFIANNTDITFQGGDRPAPNMNQMIYTEFYQLAASAYAVVPDAAPHTVTPGGTPVWNLTLHANYQPWNGGNYLLAGAQSMLLRNVSVFRFTEEQNSVRIKLCVIEAIGTSTEISICKEKAVIR